MTKKMILNLKKKKKKNAKKINSTLIHREIKIEKKKKTKTL